MKNTEMILKTMQETLNNNEECQRLMTVLAEKAEAANMSKEELEDGKQKLFNSIFFKIILEHEDLKQLVAIDAYNLLKES